MSTETAPAAPATPTTPPPKDPFLERLKGSLQIAVSDNPATTDATPETATLPRFGASTLGEYVFNAGITDEKPAEATTEGGDKKPDAPTDPKPAETTPSAPAAVAPTAPATPSAPAPEPEKPKPAPKKVAPFRPTEAPVQPQPQPQPRQDPEPQRQAQTQPPTEDEKFLATLNEDERDEYELAVFAAKQNPLYASKPAETLNFFKRVQAFAASNPQASQESEEFQELIETHRPKWSKGDRRRIETKRITEAATQQAIEKVKSEIQPVADKLQSDVTRVEMMPHVAANVDHFKRGILAAIKPPDGVEGVSSEVIADALSLSPSELVEKHPLEGEVIADHISKIEEFEKIAMGVTRFNPGNPKHAWLSSAFQSMESSILSNPSRMIRDGKTFITQAEMRELEKNNPAQALRHWCVSDEMFKHAIASNVHLQVHDRIKENEKAGFVRAKPAKAETQTPPTDKPKPSAPAKPQAKPNSDNDSPVASVSSAPGAGSASSSLTEGQRFIKNRLPGYKF